MSGKKTDREIERKYLIIRPTDGELAAIEGVKRSDILQTYLSVPENGARRRVRRRGISPDWVYTYTEKTDVSFGERIEIEREVSFEEYERLLRESSPDRPPIDKSRYVFEYEGQTFELDVYDFGGRYATLEIELDDIGREVHLPPYLDIVADVTGDKRYNNSRLAATRRLLPPDEM